VIPDPFVIVDGIGAASDWGWAQIATGIARWVLGAIGELIDGVLNFLKTSARPDVSDLWFSGPGSPFSSVRNVAAGLLVGFLLLGILQGVITGEVGGLMRRILLDAPTAVLGMIATVAVVDVLLDVTDALSTRVLGGSDSEAFRFLEGFGAASHLATGGFSTVLIGIVAVFAVAMVWVELMVRASLVYLLVAMSPLVFAASVWPAARGMLRRLVELLVAVVLAKLVISIALAVGVAALGGAGSAAGEQPGVGEWAAQGLGGLVVGTSVLCLAAFSPFMVLKLMPLAESALVAQGLSRAPAGAGRSGMTMLYYGQSVQRLAGSGSTGSDGPVPDGVEPPPFGPFDPAPTGDVSGPITASTQPGAGSTPVAGESATAGAAGGGPAVVLAVGAEATNAARDAAQAGIDQARALVDQAGGSNGAAGGDQPWSRVPNEPPPSDPSEPPRERP